MATDVGVQYFSHLNGLTLGDNWGDLIRLLDKALVTGVDFTSITAASIDAQGDVHITLYAAHNAMLFQVVELTGFAPASLNQKYRIKGVPSTIKLILKPHTAIAETSITTVGAGKLAPLGYEIIFRDTNDVKRVYRAKNPTAQHPFIRVDETISDGVNSYNSAYAKSAMVGLIENMTHIDDYQDPNKLQLPLDTNDFSKNWKIIGTGANVVRGWSKWYWASLKNGASSFSETGTPLSGNRPFTLCGDKDVFYFMPTVGDINDAINSRGRKLYGAGIFEGALKDDVVPNWLLLSSIYTTNANHSNQIAAFEGGCPLASNDSESRFFCPKYDVVSRISNHEKALPILPNYLTGRTTIFTNTPPGALQIPFSDTQNKLRGTMKIVNYRGVDNAVSVTTPMLADSSIYVADCYEQSWEVSIYPAINFYLGELE